MQRNSYRVQSLVDVQCSTITKLSDINDAQRDALRNLLNEYQKKDTSDIDERLGTSSCEENSPQAEFIKFIGDSKHRCGLCSTNIAQNSIRKHLETHHKVSQNQINYDITSCNSDRGIKTKQSDVHSSLNLLPI